MKLVFVEQPLSLDESAKYMASCRRKYVLETENVYVKFEEAVCLKSRFFFFSFSVFIKFYSFYNFVTNKNCIWIPAKIFFLGMVYKPSNSCNNITILSMYFLSRNIWCKYTFCESRFRTKSMFCSHDIFLNPDLR